MGLHRLPSPPAALLKCFHTQYFNRLSANHGGKSSSADVGVRGAFWTSLFSPVFPLRPLRLCERIVFCLPLACLRFNHPLKLDDKPRTLKIPFVHDLVTLEHRPLRQSPPVFFGHVPQLFR